MLCSVLFMRNCCVQDLCICHPGNQLVAWIQHAVTYFHWIKQNQGRKTCVFWARGGEGRGDAWCQHLARLTLFRQVCIYLCVWGFCFSAFAKDLLCFWQTLHLSCGFSLRSVHRSRAVPWINVSLSRVIAAGRSKDFLLLCLTTQAEDKSSLRLCMCTPPADPCKLLLHAFCFDCFLSYTRLPVRQQQKVSWVTSSESCCEWPMTHHCVPKRGDPGWDEKSVTLKK